MTDERVQERGARLGEEVGQQHLACDALDALLAARADGTLTPADARAMYRHLAVCETCRVVADTMSPTNASQADHVTLPQIDPAAYALGLEVARGGMGRILAARDLRVGRPVAVKELLDRSTPLAVRFEREARVTARLQHPGIVPIYEIGKWPDGTPFYAMRLVEGRTLREAIDDAPTLAARLALVPAVIAATEAVAFAHNLRVIHRDLTPSNVLVGAYGETVVIDWGLAKDLGGDAEEPLADPYRADPEGLTGVGAVIGTAAYMPPEQAHAASVDERADVYALGAILYHLLSGTPPYRKDALAQLKAGPPAAIERVATGAPRDLVSIVGKAMARDPAQRYPSARELAEELKRFQTGRMVEAHDYTRADRVGRFVRRHRAVVTMAGAAAAALALVGAVSVQRILRSRADARATVTNLLEERGRTELLAGDTLRALAYLDDARRRGADSPSLRFLLAAAVRDAVAAELTLDCGGDVRFLAMSPDGRDVAAACHDVGRVWRLADGAPVATLGPAAGGFDGVEFSHDGKTIATWGSDGIVRLWDRRGGLRTSAAHGANITFTTFMPDDTRIATTGFDGEARIFDAHDGHLVREIVASTSVLHHLYGLLSRDGKRLFTVTFAGEVRGWDTDTGASIGLEDHGSFVVGGDLAPDGALGVTCGMNHLVKLWDVSTGAAVRTLAGHTDVVWKCVFSPDGRRVLTASHDGTAKVWDIETGALVGSVAHGGIVWTGHFAPDSRRFATIGVDGSVKVWDAETGGLLATHDSLGGKDARFSLDGTRLVVQRGDGRIDIVREPALATLAWPRGGGLLGTTPDGRRAAVESPDGWIHLHDTTSGVALSHAPIHAPIAFADGRVAAVSGDDVVVLDARDGHTLARVPGHPRELALSGTGDRLAIVNDPSVARPSGRATETPDNADIVVWDDHRRVATLSGDHVLLDATGAHALAWRTGGTPELVDVDSGALVALPISGAYRPLGFGEDCVAIAAGDRVMVWSLAGTLSVAIADVTSATLDPRGALLTTIGVDHAVTIRRASDGSELAAFVGEPLLEAESDPSGALIAGIGERGTEALVLDASDGRVLARWPIAHLAPAVSETSFDPAHAIAWWTRDGHSIVTRAATLTVWDASSDVPANVDGVIGRVVPWQVVDGRLVWIKARLRGRVVRGEVPVDGARVDAVIRRPANLGAAPISWESAAAQVHELHAESGGDGTFEIDDMFPGQYEVHASESGATSIPIEVYVNRADDPVELDLE